MYNAKSPRDKILYHPYFNRHYPAINDKNCVCTTFSCVHNTGQTSKNYDYLANFYAKNENDNENDNSLLDDYFKIIMIIDESGSMNNIKDNMLKSINSLITEQKQVKERPTTFTVVKFNNVINRVIKNKNLNDINLLKNTDYLPSGTTSLYDAIGDTINWFKNEKNVLMVIITDGMDNASKKYTKKQILSLIEQKKMYNNWSYVYLSCDLSTENQGNDLGLKKSSFASNCNISQSAYGDFIGNKLNVAITNFRTNGISVQQQLNKQ